MNYDSSWFVIVIVFFVILNVVIPYMVIKFFLMIIRAITTNGFKKSVVTIDRTSNTKNGLEMGTGNKKRSVYNDVSSEELKIFNTESIDAFKDYLFDIFYRFEKAYNNLDYDTMKFLSTKQLYENYYTGISIDLKLGKKRIIDKIERKKVIIYEVDSTVAKQSASIMVEISYINYVVDSHGEIISGYREKPITEKFEVEFRKYFESHDITKCKNCGAIVKGNKCEYCRTRVESEDFRISSIRKIIEK